jgi:hypothetical protein
MNTTTEACMVTMDGLLEDGWSMHYTTLRYVCLRRYIYERLKAATDGRKYLIN